MGQKRRTHSARFKLQVVMESITGNKTYSQIISEYWIHSSQINARKQQFMENAENIFTDKRLKAKEQNDKEQEKIIEWLYKKVGQLTIERDWLEKKINWLPNIFWKS